MERFLNPKNDFAFKKLFGEEKHKDILIAFLNDIFEGVHDRIEEVEFLGKEQPPEIEAYRQSIVDVKCRDSKNRNFIIEMQYSKDSSFIKRACVYACRAYADQVTEGVPYSLVTPVIFLAIVDFMMFPNKKAYLSHHKTIDVTTGECDIKEMSFSFLELKKIDRKLEESKTMVEKWAYFFRNATSTTLEELEIIEKEYPIIGEAYNALAHHAFTKEQIDEYFKYTLKSQEIDGRLTDAKREGLVEGWGKGLKRGKMEGLVEGERKGKIEEKREIAKKLLSMGLSEEQISQGTGLSIGEIEEIQ
jgi:predicted transposase/invertase (TIGR01784 family)